MVVLAYYEQIFRIYSFKLPTEEYLAWKPTCILASVYFPNSLSASAYTSLLFADVPSETIFTACSLHLKYSHKDKRNAKTTRCQGTGKRPSASDLPSEEENMQKHQNYRMILV